VVFGHPVPQVGRQKKRSLVINGFESGSHVILIPRPPP